jgi:riboflavin biosynthesis pyrimidine reductase
VDKIVGIIAPKILGKGLDTIHDLYITDINKALPFSFDKVYRSGRDIVVEGRPALPPER